MEIIEHLDLFIPSQTIGPASSVLPTLIGSPPRSGTESYFLATATWALSIEGAREWIWDLLHKTDGVYQWPEAASKFMKLYEFTCLMTVLFDWQQLSRVSLVFFLTSASRDPSTEDDRDGIQDLLHAEHIVVQWVTSLLSHGSLHYSNERSNAEWQYPFCLGSHGPSRVNAVTRSSH